MPTMHSPSIATVPPAPARAEGSPHGVHPALMLRSLVGMLASRLVPPPAALGEADRLDGREEDGLSIRSS